MLEVQHYLRAGKSLQELSEDLGIRIQSHDVLPLMILNYHQIDSPKTHPIVRECRGLVLRSDDYSLVARSFPRFFNWGEVIEEMSDFDFMNFTVETKEDGSLALLYHFEGQWMLNTRGSFGQDTIRSQKYNWHDVACLALKINSLQDLSHHLSPDMTYICEICSPYNKVIRRYEAPKMYLITIFQGEQELPQVEVDQRAGALFYRPALYHYQSLEEITRFLQNQSAEDPTFEGVVIRDRHNHRWKIKNPTYLSLHKMRGSGDNLFNPKNLLPFVLSGEGDELLTYFPEVSEAYSELKQQVDEKFEELIGLWEVYWRIEDQKEFALQIHHHPFSSVLFYVRKHYRDQQTIQDVKAQWRKSEGLIFRQLFPCDGESSDVN